MNRSLRLIFGLVLLVALGFGLYVVRPALATPETAIVKGNIVTWRGGGANNAWSNPANWQGDAVPREHDIVRFAAGASDALIDSGFEGDIGGITLEADYQGTLTLARPLTVRGDVQLAGGKLQGGTAPLMVEGKATVTGGILTAPNNLMSVTALDIQAPGIVQMGANGKLNLTGDGTPLTGDGLLDTTTYTPNSVEYTGHATTNLTTAGPAAAFHALANTGRRASDQSDWTPMNARESLPLAPSTFTRTNNLPLNSGEDDLVSAVIDTAAGFAYFGTWTYPSGIVVKVRLSDFTRVGALTMNAGEYDLFSAVIDTANDFAYFGAYSGIVVRVRLSNFTRVDALPLNSGAYFLRSAAIDTTNGFAYFGANTSPGILVKVRLSNFTRVGALTLNSGEDYLRSVVIDTTSGSIYLGTYTSPGHVVKVNPNSVFTPTRVGALTLDMGENSLGSAVIDPPNGFAYFGTDTTPANVVKVNLNSAITPTRVSALTLNTGEIGIGSAVIDTVNGFAYFGASASPGNVVKVKLSDFTRVGTLSLNTGENYPAAAVIDTAHGFAYFGTYTSPGIVVKIALGVRLFLPLVVR